MFDRIESNPAILNGKPVVRGTRISVEFLLELAASGASRDEILQRFPTLQATDVEQAFLYAGNSLRNEGTICVEVVH